MPIKINIYDNTNGKGFHKLICYILKLFLEIRYYYSSMCTILDFICFANDLLILAYSDIIRIEKFHSSVLNFWFMTIVIRSFTVAKGIYGGWLQKHNTTYIIFHIWNIVFQKLFYRDVFLQKWFVNHFHKYHLQNN